MMFTGVVAAQGVVQGITHGAVVRIEIDAGDLASGTNIGGSLAVNGICLTVVAKEHSVVAVEAVEETLQRTNLGRLDVGDGVNLERPVGPDGLFEGHIVQGHVDGVAEVRSVVSEGGSRRVAFDLAGDLLRYIVEKGSVALDGVSLTVTATDASGFEVALIPHTLDVTNLGRKTPGDLVNVEIDVIAKYVERLVG